MTDGNTYAINKHLNEREDFDALEEVTAELEQAEARIEELEAENKRLNEQMDAIEEMGTESLNALPDCLMRLAPALVENDELKAKLAKAMQVVEMIASADVDAVLGEAVDLSCEIIGELMEEEDDE
jgi:seryl-tRNA synthetase